MTWINKYRGSQTSHIVARDCNDAYLCQPPLLPEAFALPGHIQLQRLDDRAHALEVEPLTEGEVRELGEPEDELVTHERPIIYSESSIAPLPTRNAVWRAAMLGILGGAVAAD